MNTIKLFAISLFVLASAPGEGQKKEGISDFYWLVGQWRNVKSGAIELWDMDKNKSYMEGKLVEVAKGDTTINETMAIEFQKGHFYFMADTPANPSPVLFKIVDSGKDYFLAENKAHDFPKQIRYQAIGRDAFKATISGNGRSVDFSFERVL